MNKGKIVVPAGTEADEGRKVGPLKRFNRWLAELGASFEKWAERTKENYGNILKVLSYTVMLALPIGMMLEVSGVFRSHSRPPASKPVSVPDERTLDALRAQQATLSQKAEQLEKRLAGLSATDVSERIAAFESQISALDTYIGELFEPKKGKDVLIVKSIVDDLKQLRERATDHDAEIQRIELERIRIETKIDTVQADQRKLLHWVLSLGAFLFVGLLVGIRYLGKKLEPLVLAPSLLNQDSDSRQDSNSEG